MIFSAVIIGLLIYFVISASIPKPTLKDPCKRHVWVRYKRKGKLVCNECFMVYGDD